LFNLNEYLIEFANGNFVTAMYAVIDFSKKELHYSHAGHSYPFLFAKNSVSELSINHKRKPLGILDRESLEATGKSYVTEKIDLSEYSKILFFTDGLMEAMRYEKEEEVYYEERLTSLIHMHKDQLSQGLLELIVSDLKEFINGTSLQDDICIIAIDLFKQ
jgi:serine phosphatase RsbU (regulator of sigma subunit)